MLTSQLQKRHISVANTNKFEYKSEKKKKRRQQNEEV